MWKKAAAASLRRKSAIIAIIAAISLAILISHRYRYVPYVPVAMEIQQGEPVLVQSPELATPELLTAVDHILDRYDEPYVWEDGVLYISAPLSADHDLVWNYTTKARDLLNPDRETWTNFKRHQIEHGSTAGDTHPARQP